MQSRRKTALFPLLLVLISDFSTACYVARFQDAGMNPKNSEIWVTFPSEICTNGFLLGVAFDDKDRLYVAVDTWAGRFNPGVFRVEANRSLTQVMSLPPGSFPNGIAFYGDDLYVSGTSGGAIWKKSPKDKPDQPVLW